MLVVYALGRSFNTRKSVCILYQIKAEIIYFVSRSYKNMRSLGINGFETVASYNAVYFRCTVKVWSLRVLRKILSNFHGYDD